MDDRSKKTLLVEPCDSDLKAVSEKETSSESPRRRGKGERVPRVCLLDGFARELQERRGVNLCSLEALTELRVRTASAVYHITVLDPVRSEVLIQGGALFAEAARMTLSGASLGRSFLKMKSIWIGLQMELHAGDCTVVTSPVSAIELLKETYPTGSFAA